jgi:hypothetical protein
VYVIATPFLQSEYRLIHEPLKANISDLRKAVDALDYAFHIEKDGERSKAVVTWAADSNSFSPDHRPDFAAGAVHPFTTTSGITNKWWPCILMCSWINGKREPRPAAESATVSQVFALWLTSPARAPQAAKFCRTSEEVKIAKFPPKLRNFTHRTERKVDS